MSYTHFPVSSVSNSNYNYVASTGGAAPYNYCSGSNYSTYHYTVSLGYSDIFIAKALDQSRQPYDYYKRTGTGCDKPFVGVCINKDNPWSETYCAADSVVACGQMDLYAASNAASSADYIGYVGPNFKYAWSTGAKVRNINVTATGKYNVTLTTEDGCFTSRDTIYATINPVPSKPTYTGKISLCTPDSTTITFGNIDSGTTHKLTGTGLPANGIDTNSITTKVSASYNYAVTNQYGCPNSTSVYVSVQSAPTPLDTIVPKVKLLNDFDNNDSVGFCAGGIFQLMIYDSIKNPLGTNKSVPNMTNVSWSITPSSFSYYWGNPTSTFYPSVSGWYNLTGTITLSSSTSCGSKSFTYQVSKKVYVTVNPYPVVSNPISGNTVVCQGQTTTLSVPKADSYSWSGPGIISATNKDSIQINATGRYCNTSTISLNGCSKNNTTCKSVTLRTAPSVTFNPTNGLICPKDSVELTTTAGEKYLWYGPTSTGTGLLGNTQSIKVNIPGYYYCVVTDSSGCQLTSETKEVKQYATPFLYASPNTFMCKGDKVLLNVATNTGSVITWAAPLSGSALTQTITAAGTYTATVKSCGITTPAELKITSANPLAKITASGPLNLCEGDSVTLYANKGMSNYKWTPGNTFGDSIVVKNKGTYTVKTTDENGCSATSDPVTTTLTKKIPPPTASPQTVCKGVKATLTASSSGGIIEWYSDSVARTKVGTGNQYITPALTKDIIYYIQTPIAYCDTIRVPVKVFINAASYPPVVKSNAPVCEGDTLTLTTDSASQVIYSWTGPGNFTSNSQNISIPKATFALSGNYSLVLKAVGAGCASDTTSRNVVVKTTPSTPVINNNSPLCAGKTLKLTTDITLPVGTIYSWTGPDSLTSALQNLQIPNSTIADSGAYSLVVSLDGCPSPKATIPVIIKPVPPSPNLSSNTPLCEGDMLVLKADTIANVSYSWEGPKGFNSTLQNPVIDSVKLNDAGRYSAYVTMNGCSGTIKNISVTVNPLPKVDIQKQNIICPLEEPLVLNPGNYESYSWQDSSKSSTFIADASGIYWVVVENKFGCIASDTVVVIERCPSILYVPNAFTPNNDFTNDVFNAKGNYLTSYRMRIFNRWGELLFETNDLNYGWEGKYKGEDVPQGVYVWTIYAEGFDKDGEANFSRTGHVTLIR